MALTTAPERNSEGALLGDGWGAAEDDIKVNLKKERITPQSVEHNNRYSRFGGKAIIDYGYSVLLAGAQRPKNL